MSSNKKRKRSNKDDDYDDNTFHIRKYTKDDLKEDDFNDGDSVSSGKYEMEDDEERNDDSQSTASQNEKDEEDELTFQEIKDFDREIKNEKKKKNLTDVPSKEDDAVEKKKKRHITHVDGEESDEYSSANEEYEPFNLKEEMRSGKFDQFGYYTWNKADSEEEDNFIDNIKFDDIYTGPVKEVKEESIPSFLELLYDSLCLMNETETVTKCLKRLGEEDFDTFNKFTESVDLLLNHYNFEDVYQKSKSELNKIYTKRYIKQVSPEIAKIKWKYKWNLDGQVFGPFGTQQMLEWLLEGFFQANPLVCKSNVDTCNNIKNEGINTHVGIDGSNNENTDLINDIMEDEYEWVTIDKIDFLTGTISH